MLRFFEPEVDSWWPPATPPPPQRRCITPADPWLQAAGSHYGQSGALPSILPVPPAGRRVPSILTTVDLVKGRWFPATAASNESRSPSPKTSSSVDSMNSYGDCGLISWQGSNAFSIESPLDPSLAAFQVSTNEEKNICTVERSSSIAMDTGRRKQHDDAMVDLRKQRRILDESESIEVVVTNAKRQKTCVHQEKLQYCFPSFESNSSPSARLMIRTNNQTLKQPVRKSQKLGDKITALQQLVSPFGKTDTASVLHEAALCIKTLHEQIKLLSRPYLESISSFEGIDQGITNGSGDHNEQKTGSFRGVGLCMVPVSPAIASLVNQEHLDRYMRESFPW